MTEQGLDYRLIDSGQHAAFAPPLRRSLGVKEPDIYLVLRSETERQEGLGGNVVMDRFDKDVIQDFLQHHERYRSGQAISNKLPSLQVLDSLRSWQE